MAEQVRAIYEKGVLRPLRPLNLREHQMVDIQIMAEAEKEDAAELVRLLAAAGLITPPPGHSAEAPISEEERRALADRLGRIPGKPLSEMIIEDRGNR
ncbi:MAG: antitoxin family protein [Anaerolineae bacterium]|nr:antitoxin family protein [Anaerolineae bacterium]